MRSKVAIHVHSTWSYDGRLSLEEVATLFRRLRFDAVFMSEHDRGFDQPRWDAYRSACAEASRAPILIPGIEYEDAENAVHVLVWGDLPFLSFGSVTELLRRARELGGISILAHPARRDALARLTPTDHDLLDGVEIWNRRYDGWAPPAGAEPLAERDELLRIVGLDLHRRLDFFPLALRLDARAPLTAQVATDALRAGRFVPEFLGVPASRFFAGQSRTVLRSLDRARTYASRALRIGG